MYTRRTIWTTHLGAEIKICDMTDAHLSNWVMWLQFYRYNSDLLDIAEDEVSLRKLVLNDVQIPYHDGCGNMIIWDFAIHGPKIVRVRKWWDPIMEFFKEFRFTPVSWFDSEDFGINMNINNKNDWWTLLESNWDNILNIASDQLDVNSLAFEIPGNPESKMTGRNVLQEMNHLKIIKDSNISRYLNAIWGLASDAYARENRRGWKIICDLCSEEYVLYEE